MVWPNADERQRREQRAEEQHADRRHGRPQVAERNTDHEDDDDQLVAERLDEILQRLPDERRPVVGRHQLDAGGQRRLELLQLAAERVGHGQHVSALLHDGNAAHDLAGAVQIRDPAAQVVARLHVADVLELHGLAGLVAAEDQKLELVEVVGLERAAKLILAVGHLDRASAGFLERAFDDADDLPEGDTALAQERRKQLDLILLLEPADGRDLGDARRRLQRRLDLALVEQPQLAQIARTLVIDERVLEDPAHAAGVGPDGDVRVCGKLRADSVQTVRNELPDGGAMARILEDHVDERVPHVGSTSDRLDLR